MVKKGKNSVLKNPLLKYYLLIFISAFILYGKSINNDFNIDDDYVYENHPLVQKGISGIPEIFTSRYHDRDEYYFGYRPLTIALFAIEYEFFGMNPHTGHFFNIIYYIICCSLLFYSILKLLEKKYKNNSEWIAFLITIIFTTHAIHSEVVLSLKNREEIVSLILCLLSLIYAIKYFDKKQVFELFIAIILLALAFLAKESAVVFIAIIPLAIIFFRTEIRILSGFDSLFKKFFERKNLPLSSILIWIVFFIIATPAMEIKQGLFIYRHNLNIGVHPYVPLIMFFAHYFYIILIYKTKHSIPFIKLKNIVLWTLSVVGIILTGIEGSIFPMFMAMPLCSITLYPLFKNNVPKVNIINNVQPKLLIFISAFIMIASTIIILSYLLPKQALPEINAPVHRWQNPMFDTDSTFSENMGLVLYSLIYYLKLLFVPFPLRYYYGYNMIPNTDLTDFTVIISLLFHLVLFIYAIRLFNKRELISFGILFYLIAIVPYSNLFFPFTGIIAERVLFIPSIGFSIAITYIIYLIVGKKSLSTYSKANSYKTIFLAGILILPNSLISIKRNDDWKNRDVLYATDIKVLENSAKANNVYASHIFGKVQMGIRQQIPLKSLEREVNISVKHYKRAIEIDTTYSEALHNLGYVYMLIYRDYKLADYYFSKCLDNDSTIAAAYLNRGITNYHLSRFENAITDFNNYLTKNTNYKNKELDKAYVFMAKSFFEKGDTAMATDFYLTAISNLKQSNLTPAVLKDIKDYLLSVKEYSHAINVTEMQINLTPEVNQLYVDIGNFHLLSGDTVQAVESWGRAFEHFRGNYNIAMTLKNYYESIGEYDKANYYFNAASEFRLRNHQ